MAPPRPRPSKLTTAVQFLDRQSRRRFVAFEPTDLQTAPRRDPRVVLSQKLKIADVLADAPKVSLVTWPELDPIAATMEAHAPTADDPGVLVTSADACLKGDGLSIAIRMSERVRSSGGPLELDAPMLGCEVSAIPEEVGSPNVFLRCALPGASFDGAVSVRLGDQLRTMTDGAVEATEYAFDETTLIQQHDACWRHRT